MFTRLVTQMRFLSRHARLKCTGNEHITVSIKSITHPELTRLHHSILSYLGTCRRIPKEGTPR